MRVLYIKWWNRICLSFYTVTVAAVVGSRSLCYFYSAYSFALVYNIILISVMVVYIYYCNVHEHGTALCKRDVTLITHAQ